MQLQIMSFGRLGNVMNTYMLIKLNNLARVVKFLKIIKDIQNLFKEEIKYDLK